MKLQRADTEALKARLQEQHAPTEDTPGDIARFRTRLGMHGDESAQVSPGQEIVRHLLAQTHAPQSEDLQLAHLTDFDASQSGNAPRPLRESGHERGPLSRSFALKPTAPRQQPGDERTPQRDQEAPRLLRRRPSSHADREQAMRPLADLLQQAHRRGSGSAAADMKIMPPSPNPLRLTLQLSMRGNDFIVHARSGLAGEHREHVRQSLQTLEQALAQRLRDPVRARVILLA